MPDLTPLAAVAASWGVCTRTVRRRITEAMEADRGLTVTRQGRAIMFTDAQLARFVEALVCQRDRRAHGRGS